MKQSRTPLSEQEKIRIIECEHQYGRRWELIGQIVNRHPNTCQSFFDSYSKHQTINPVLGRPAYDSLLKDGIVGSLAAYGCQTLSNVANDFDCSQSFVRTVAINNGIRYYPSFLARCKVCASINGESLNGLWKEVRKLHDTYRTQLVIVRNPIRGLLQQIETQVY